MYAWPALAWVVSVPLRGSGHESQLCFAINSTSAFGFQSPCGEVVMKGGYMKPIVIQFERLFQSPCGEVVMKVHVDTVGIAVYDRGFQSPCGEVVMKD